MSTIPQMLSALLSLSLLGVGTAAVQDGYPTRAVRVLAGVGAGGAPDVVARLAGQWLSERLGQSCPASSTRQS